MNSYINLSSTKGVDHEKVTEVEKLMECFPSKSSSRINPEQRFISYRHVPFFNGVHPFWSRTFIGKKM